MLGPVGAPKAVHDATDWFAVDVGNSSAAQSGSWLSVKVTGPAGNAVVPALVLATVALKVTGSPAEAAPLAAPLTAAVIDVV